MADGDALPMVLAVGLLLILGTLSGSALAEETSQDEDPDRSKEPVLHLRGDHPGGGSYRNFTTKAPDGADPFAVAPCSVATQGTASWCWQTHRSPEPWTLSAGSPAEAVVHLGALQRVPLGLLDTQDPEQSGRLRIDVVLTRGTSDEVAHGTAWVDPPMLAAHDEATVRVPLEVPQDTHWNTEPGDAPAVELQVHLSGLVRRDEPPLILTGSEQHDSRLFLPGFPLDAFRDWEQEEDEEDTCREKILAQHSCDEENETELTKRPHSPLTQEAPAHGIIALIAALLVGAHRTRRRLC